MKFYVSAGEYAESIKLWNQDGWTKQCLYRAPVNFFYGLSPFDIHEVEIARLDEIDDFYGVEECYYIPGPLTLGRAIPLEAIGRETVKLYLPPPGTAYRPEIDNAVVVGRGDVAAENTGRAGGVKAISLERGNAFVKGADSLALTLEEHSGAAADGENAHALTAAHGCNAAASGRRGCAISLREGWAIAGGPAGHALAIGHWGGSAISCGADGLAVTTRDKAYARGARGRALAADDRGSAAATGPGGEAAALGENGRAETAAGGLAVATGRGGRAKGPLGAWLVLAWRDVYERPKMVAAVRVDGKTIKPDVWYVMDRGRIVPAPADKPKK